MSTLFVYFDQGGMFGNGCVYIGKKPLPPSEDENDLKNFFFTKIEKGEYWHRSCILALLYQWRQIHKFDYRKGSLTVEDLLKNTGP